MRQTAREGSEGGQVRAGGGCGTSKRALTQRQREQGGGGMGMGMGTGMGIVWHNDSSATHSLFKHDTEDFLDIAGVAAPRDPRHALGSRA